jgi:hypothetical protein
VREFDEFRGIACEIQAHEIDLAAVYSAAIVHHPKVGRLGAATGAIFGEHSGIGHDVADLDVGICCARIIAFLRERRGGEQGARQK